MARRRQAITIFHRNIWHGGSDTPRRAGAVSRSNRTAFGPTPNLEEHWLTTPWEVAHPALNITRPDADKPALAGWSRMSLEEDRQ